VMWSVTAGEGQPVVFVHGAFCDYRYWLPQLEIIGRRHKAIAVSLPGYHPDRFPDAERFSAAAHVDELGEFLKRLDSPGHLIGHSRGGRIALNVAAKYENSVCSLVLIEPGGEMEPGFLPKVHASPEKPSSAIDVRKEAEALIVSGAKEDGMRLYIDNGHGKGAWSRLPSEVQKILLSSSETITGMLRDRTSPLAREVANAVSAPTLLIGGKDSPAVFARIIEVLEECLPNSARFDIDGADHFMSYAKASVFNRVILDWLAIAL
jgi:pimeloyl-ACP methyl ester carboxylesterase